MDAVAELYAAQAFWIWVGLAAGLLGIEVLTGSGWLLWASASAAVTAVVLALIDISVPATLLVFAVLTMLSTLLARRYVPRDATAQGGDINDNVGRLVGRQGLVVGAFVRGAGRVSIDGKEWAAELEDGNALAAGASVRVIGVDGARLRVHAV